MTLPTSGTIKLDDVAHEFGDGGNHSLSEFRGVMAGVPTSGPISLSDLHGKHNRVFEITNPQAFNGQFTYTRGQSRHYNNKTDYSPVFPNNWNNFGITEQHNSTTGQKYFSNFNGVDNYLWADGRYGTWYTSGNISSTQDIRDRFNADYVLSMFVYPTAHTANDGDTSLMLFGGFSGNIHITLESGKPQARLRGYTQSVQYGYYNQRQYKYATSPDTIALNNWHHIAMAFRSSHSNPGAAYDMDLWVNNILKARTTWTNTNTTYAFADDWEIGIMYAGQYAQYGQTAPGLVYLPPTNTQWSNLFAYKGMMAQIALYDGCPSNTNNTLGSYGTNAQVNGIFELEGPAFGL